MHAVVAGKHWTSCSRWSTMSSAAARTRTSATSAPSTPSPPPLSSTALVHEAYLQLVDIERVDFHDRTHFLAVAATAMRRILVDSARRHRAAKRGGGAGTLSLDNVAIVSLQSSEEILVLDGALEKLGRETQRLARIVELRFFGGLTIEETAGALGVAPSTVQLDWQKAKAWLYRELREA
jgi:RNA polymerase sigma factor (TIGR02999 family)